MAVEGETFLVRKLREKLQALRCDGLAATGVPSLSLFRWPLTLSFLNITDSHSSAFDP